MVLPDDASAGLSVLQGGLQGLIPEHSLSFPDPVARMQSHSPNQIASRFAASFDRRSSGRSRQRACPCSAPRNSSHNMFLPRRPSLCDHVDGVGVVLSPAFGGSTAVARDFSSLCQSRILVTSGA